MKEVILCKYGEVILKGANRSDFEAIVDPLWRAYNESPSRVPLTDWYDTVTSCQCGFQNRTVVGGYFIQLLAYKGYMKVD